MKFLIIFQLIVFLFLSVGNAFANEDPDLTGQPGTPERTQGSGTR